MNDEDRQRTWMDVERSSQAFWSSSVPTSSHGITLADIKSFAASASYSFGPRIVLMSDTLQRGAGALGQAEVAQILADACRHCRPIFGDIIHTPPDWRRAAAWIIGGPWPYDRGPWYSAW